MLQHGTIEYAYKGTVVYTGVYKGPPYVHPSDGSVASSNMSASRGTPSMA